MFKSPVGIIETGDGSIDSMSARRTLVMRPGSNMSSTTLTFSPLRLPTRPVTTSAVLLVDDDRLVLVADDLAGLDDRFEQVAHAEAADDAGQIGADRAAFVDEAMAGRAGHGAIELPAALEVAPALQAAFDDRAPARRASTP